MPPSAEPPFEPQTQGISLDELAEAFAQVMGVERPAAVSPEAQATAPTEATTVAGPDEEQARSDAPSASDEAAESEDACPIGPLSIFEAMLFVGNRENRPLTPAQAAELMRDVAIEDVPPLVDELNAAYEARGAAYRIVCEGDGYRLALRPDLYGLRDSFFGRVREARLSQASIDVLALVAYQQPITGEQIGRLRGKPSNHLLAHLVRRGLLRIERPEPKRRTPHYRTTDRFLRLFNLESLDDLPRSEDPEPL